MKRAPSRIDAAATRWVVRMHSDRLTSDDEAAFAAWIAQDSAHRLAYDKQAALWTGIAALRHDGAALAVIEPLLHSGEVDVKRRGLLAASVVGVLAAGAGGWRVWKLLAPETYATAVGEQRRIVLADGSTVTLNMNSVLRVHFDGEQRRVWLDRGQAFFDVAKYPAQPFRVFAGADEVRALGAAFDVYRQGEGARVTIEKGTVSVFCNADQGETTHAAKRPAIVLTPNEQAIVTPVEPVKVAPVDTRQAIAWRHGSPATRLPT